MHSFLKNDLAATLVMATIVVALLFVYLIQVRSDRRKQKREVFERKLGQVRNALTHAQRDNRPTADRISEAIDNLSTLAFDSQTRELTMQQVSLWRAKFHSAYQD